MSRKKAGHQLANLIELALWLLLFKRARSILQRKNQVEARVVQNQNLRKGTTKLLAQNQSKTVIKEVDLKVLEAKVPKLKGKNQRAQEEAKEFVILFQRDHLQRPKDHHLNQENQLQKGKAKRKNQQWFPKGKNPDPEANQKIQDPNPNQSKPRMTNQSQRTETHPPEEEARARAEVNPQTKAEAEVEVHQRASLKNQGVTRKDLKRSR